MVRLEGVSKVYSGRRNEVRALDEVNLHVEQGEFVAVKGPSGSGKSTLLLTIGAMVHPTAGRVLVADTDVYSLSSRDRASFRAKNIGFVFQMFHLVPYLSVLENVLVPTLAAARPETAEGGCATRTDGAPARARELLERFGMSDRIDHRPAELSTGERQRVAMARALLNRPRLILADEPTGNLDPDNAAEVMNYLEEFHRDGGTVLIVTHEQAVEQHTQRIVLIRQGRVEDLTQQAAPS